MARVVDLVIYIVLILFFVCAIIIEANHYVCDAHSCAFISWADDRSTNARDKYINMIELQTRQSVWMRSYIMAFLLTVVVYYWFTGSLPPAIYFLAMFFILFFIIYFVFTFYQHHFMGPINADIKDYMSKACSKDDPRDPGPEVEKPESLRSSYGEIRNVGLGNVRSSTEHNRLDDEVSRAYRKSVEDSQYSYTDYDICEYESD